MLTAIALAVAVAGAPGADLEEDCHRARPIPPGVKPAPRVKGPAYVKRKAAPKRPPRLFKAEPKQEPEEEPCEALPPAEPFTFAPAMSVPDVPFAELAEVPAFPALTVTPLDLDLDLDERPTPGALYAFTAGGYVIAGGPCCVAYTPPGSPGEPLTPSTFAAPVPEPAEWALMAFGLLGLIGWKAGRE